MSDLFNNSVATPIGKGVAFGRFAVRGQQELITQGVLVRLVVDDQVRKQLSSSKCLTPRASHSAVFVFDESELGL